MTLSYYLYQGFTSYTDSIQLSVNIVGVYEYKDKTFQGLINASWQYKEYKPQANL